MADPVTIAAVSVSVAPVLKIALDEVNAVIKEGFHMLYGIEENVKDLERKLKAISDVLQDAENKQMNTGGRVKNWLSELTQAAYDAEDILESWATKCKLRKMKQEVSKPFTKAVSSVYKVKLMTRWDVGKTIKEISARLSKIEKLTTYYRFQKNLVVAPRARNNPRETGSFINKIDVVGREADRVNLIELLVADDEPSAANSIIPIIPIVGMGGLGKTTLARLIYNDERITGHYEFRMWVGVTETFDSTQILKDMITDDELKHNIDSLSKDQLESRLLEIISGKRFLLVLDDVWSTNYNDEWAPIQRLLNEGGRGSKILVTTRDEKVSNNMGTREPYHLQFLLYDECWNLFKTLAFKNGTPQDLENYGKEIVRKCNGLPLAVVQMGALLRSFGITDTIKWKRIAESEIWELEGKPSNSNADADRPKILPPLILSYDHLSPNLKQCFAFCSIFPKAYEFDKVELVKLWMAEKYIPLRGNERVEDTGNEYFDDLLMRFFFQPANDNKRYMMHDLIHDLAQYVSSTHCCQVKDRTASDISEATRHVSFIYEDVEQPLLNLIHNSKKLRTLLLPGRNLKAHGKSLDKMFHTLIYIRVLDLSSSTLLSLPKSIKKLTLLRYLDLSKNEIKNLPNSICSLYNLQTLKLIGCPWLFELPKDFGNLINLRHLELDEMFWYKSSSLPQRIGMLTGLHNLQAFLVGDKIGYEIGQLENMVNITGTLSISNLEYAKNAGKAMLQGKERLQKVVLKWTNRGLNVQGNGEADKKALEDLQPHSNVNQLQIYHYLGTTFPDWVRNGQLQNLVSIRLYHCTKCEILSLGALPHLSKLYIKGMQELKEWTGSPYPSLDRLHITDCPKMKELPSNFPTIRVLKIKNCKALKALPTVAQLMFLVLVDNQVLEQWNEDVQIVSSETIEGETRMTFSSASLLNLLELKIINCPAMQILPRFFWPQKLELTGCRLLGSLPDPMFTKRLQCLELDSFNDPKLVRSIPDSETLYSLIISNISNLTSLPKWPNLPKLQALYIRDCRDLISLSEQDDESWKSLTSLKLLSIQNCPQLVTFPPDGFPEQLQFFSISSCSRLKSFGSTDIFKTLIALNDLYIEDCPSLLSLPEEGVSTSLQHLCIQGCPSLTKQFRNKVGDWLKIEHIPDLEIEMVPVDTSPSSSAAWYNRGFRCNGTDVMDTVQPRQRPKPKGSTQRVDKGKNLKGKSELAEHSGSVDHVMGQDLKGKGVLEPSQSVERGKSSNGKLVIEEAASNEKLMIKEQLAEPSGSEDHGAGQSSKGIVTVAESSSSHEHSNS